MTPHYFFSSVTRLSDLWKEPFETVPLRRQHWASGDFVVGRVSGQRNRLYRCETKTGRMADVVVGDLIVGALGERAATLEAAGDWRAVDESLQLDALTGAGLLGKTTSISPLLPELVRLDYLGHVARKGQKINMMDCVHQVPPKQFDQPVVLLIGTSMSAGKTSSGQVIIRALNYLGMKVAAAKLTGAARYRDILTFRDAGAHPVIDFVDAGLPSTVCTEQRFRAAMELMLSQLAAADPDALVVEAGASPLEPYNGAIVIEYLGPLAVFTVLCASDPYSVLGVQTAYGEHLRADLVSGPAANTTAAISLVKKLTGLDALNLLDRHSYPELTNRLKTAFSL